MGIGVSTSAIYKKLIREVQESFPNLIYYNVDIPFTVRYAAAHKVFIMARCAVTAQDDGRIISIKALDTPYDLDPQLPNLRLLSLRPDTDPSFRTPRYLIVKFGKSYLRLPFDKPHELLSILNGIFASYDPDVIHTHFGDNWLLPHLSELSKKTRISFTPDRDLTVPVLRRKAVKFFNYGRAHYRALQTHLRGRWHIDVENCMSYNQYHLIGAIEQTRLSSLPLQEVARRSPGAAISAMQTLTALKTNILIPYQRQKAEIAKSFNEFYRAARGGLILQPPIGIYGNIAVMDFSSKMASIMIKYNVSPETVVSIDDPGEGLSIPELKVKVLSRPGLIPQTLQPMRDKRLALKQLLKSVDKNDSKYQTTRRRYRLVAKLLDFEAVTDALKWLTVVCYGRLRFANSIFGRINSHEVVSYLSRKAILQAKRIAEARGGRALHLYVDSVFVSLPDASKEDFQALANEIAEKTGLPMELENVYCWFAFLNSRQNPNISVANKFFGIAENGEHKIRGIAVRRGDTCSFVANIQRQIIEMMAKEKDPAKLGNLLPEILTVTQEKLSALKMRAIEPEELVISQRLSRDLNGYSVLSPAAVAARQLQTQGTTVERGQRVRFIYTAPGPGAYAWEMSTELDRRDVDVRQYKELAFRAIYEILQPLGVRERVLKDWIFNNSGYVMPSELVNPAQQVVKQELPLLADLRYLRVDKF
jgi:DNA polymerase elongation subunit (family B)